MKENYALAGHLNNGEAVYIKKTGGYCIEKDHRYLFSPTKAELAEIRNLQEPHRLAPARGIIIGMLVGAAIWVVLAIVIYFTFCRG